MYSTITLFLSDKQQGKRRPVIYEIMGFVSVLVILIEFYTSIGTGNSSLDLCCLHCWRTNASCGSVAVVWGLLHFMLLVHALWSSWWFFLSLYLIMIVVRVCTCTACEGLWGGMVWLSGFTPAKLVASAAWHGQLAARGLCHAIVYTGNATSHPSLVLTEFHDCDFYMIFR